jgi:hypothetical protein
MKICNKHDIGVPDMKLWMHRICKGRNLGDLQLLVFLIGITIVYKHDCLFNVLDFQLHKLNVRFDEEKTELLQCVSCLISSSSFVAFDVKKLLRMVVLYAFVQMIL